MKKIIIISLVSLSTGILSTQVATTAKAKPQATVTINSATPFRKDLGTAD